MKKVLVLLVTVLALNLSSAQITKTVDTMSDEITFTTSNHITGSDSTFNSRSFVMYLSLKADGDSAEIQGLAVIIEGLSCVESVEAIILLEDGNKLKMTSWNKFNCKGYAFFDITDKDINMLSNSPVSKVKFTNGRNYRTILSATSKKQSTVFVKNISDIKNNFYKTVIQ